MRALFVCILLSVLAQQSWAEPWISNRFAQNCAGCHAPGRYNREPSKRRCTLSCQGCHVNPNGGGLRNEYGRWNSRRWLRSFQSDVAWSYRAPAPNKKQKYYHQASDGSPMAKMKKRKVKAIAAHGMRLRLQKKGVFPDEADYDRTGEINNGVTPDTKLRELYVIPDGDPYRQTRKDAVIAGGNFRYLSVLQDGDDLPEQFESFNGPMALDVGIRVRPTKKYLSLVYEGRAGASPFFSPGGPTNLENLFSANNARTRSAYVLVDDLPYNSFAQYGLFRPMFGQHNPDHTNIFAQMTGLGQYSTFRTLGFGTAPNVPFGMVNIIFPGDRDATSQEKGYVVTTGLRFVSFGASIQGSYWSTEDNSSAVGVTKTMWNLNAGAAIRRFIFNLDYTNVTRELTTGSEDSGSVLTLENKFRVWREMYLLANYSTSNVAPTASINPGEGQLLQFGVKSFLLSGVELEALWFSRDYTNETNPGDRRSNGQTDGFQFMAHLYF